VSLADSVPTVRVETPPQAVQRMALAPNPTDRETRLTFDLAEPQTLRLQVNDLYGRPQRSVDLPALAAGSHDVALHLGDLPAGRYVVALYGDGGRVRAQLLTVGGR
jgi:hypothetical protein